MRTTSLSRADSEWRQRVRARVEPGHASRVLTRSSLDRDDTHCWPDPDSDALRNRGIEIGSKAEYTRRTRNRFHPAQWAGVLTAREPRGLTRTARD